MCILIHKLSLSKERWKNRRARRDDNHQTRTTRPFPSFLLLSAKSGVGLPLSLAAAARRFRPPGRETKKRTLSRRLCVPRRRRRARCCSSSAVVDNVDRATFARAMCIAQGAARLGLSVFRAALWKTLRIIIKLFRGFSQIFIGSSSNNNLFPWKH